MPSILLLFFGDRNTDRRVQNFERFFREHGWSAELVATHPGNRRGPQRFIRYHRDLSRLVAHRNADVVMACDLYSLGAAVRTKRLGNARHVIYDSREVYTELPSVADRPLVKAVWKRFEHRAIDSVDLMLVTGPHDAESIFRIHRGMPHSILVRNLPWKTDLERNRPLLAKFELDPKLPTLVYVGGLQRGRGLPQMIRAMHAFEAQLLVIGGGDMESDLRAYAAEYMVDDRVKFAGAMPAEEALRAVAACDAGISLIEPLSESYELALPSKLFEYMMAGLPVLSSPLLQVRDLFSDEPWIVFADPTNGDDIERGIRQLLAKIGNDALSERARTLAVTQYHFTADASHLLTVLDRTYGLG